MTKGRLYLSEPVGPVATAPPGTVSARLSLTAADPPTGPLRELAPAAIARPRNGGPMSHFQRRQAVAERLSMSGALDEWLEVALNGPPGQSGPADPDGSLRASVRALIGLGWRTPGYDVQISLGTDHEWAIRLHDTGDGLAIELVPKRQVAAGSGPATDTGNSGTAAELATLLWSGAVARS